MNWFLVALIPPVLYAVGNYIDKIIISKQLKGDGVRTILTFSCLLGALTLPVIFFINPHVFEISLRTSSILALNGILTVVAVFFYLHAIEHEDISRVIPILQLTPVFGFITGYLFLGETLSVYQMIGSAIVVIGAMIISLEISDVGGFKIRRKVLALAVGSSLTFSISGTIFKFFAESNGYWKTQFWEYFGIGLLGIILMIFVSSYRNNFIYVLKNNKQRLLGLNVASEIVMVSADLITNFATLLAPIALIYVVSSFQPVFVFVFGILLTIFFPHIIKESLSRKHISQKVLTIVIMVLGLFMLYR